MAGLYVNSNIMCYVPDTYLHCICVTFICLFFFKCKIRKINAHMFCASRKAWFKRHAHAGLT